jgi:putative SOS response-associated peptidase YedK
MPLTVLAAQFQADLGPLLPGFFPRFNVAPTQDVFAVRVPEPGAERQLVQLHWGLIPSWAKDKKIASSTINARADTIATTQALATPQNDHAHRRGKRQRSDLPRSSNQHATRPRR